MDGIRVCYNAQKKEFASAYREYLSGSGMSSAREPVVISMLWGACLLLMLKMHGNPVTVTVFAALSLTVLVRLYSMFLKPVLIFNRIPAELRQVSYLFSHSGIRLAYMQKEHTVGWDAFCGVLETGNHFFLIRPDRGYTLIPKRTFRNETETLLFRQLLDRAVLKKNHQE